MKISIEDLWSNYVKHVMSGIPEDSVQYIESRRVFYAASMEMLTSLFHVVGNKDLSEEQGVEVLQDMYNQCMAFFKKETGK